MSALWSGRFEKDPAPEAKALSGSLHYDSRLWRQEISVTRAHCHALSAAGLLAQDEAARIEEALDEAATLLREGRFEFDQSDEDIHSAVERFLTERCGDAGARIHAGRSRNDLVVTDTRLWAKLAIARIAGSIHGLQEALYRQSREHLGTLMPGYTHLQRAQPILLPHILLAHAFALHRDFERMVAAYRRCDVSSLGAAAFSGSSLPIDPRIAAQELGFAKIFDNAADAVSDRDFILEFLSAAAILGVHLSRIGEELVVWTTAEFGFAHLDDSFATGSSIMPQKKNPDVAELARAKSARLTANLVHLLGVMKGIPLTYNRDLQEDKEALFDSADTVEAILAALRGTFLTITFDIGRMRDAASDPSSSATGIAEHLVLAGVPFREAHEAIGKLIARAEADGRVLASFDADELRQIHPALTLEMMKVLDPVISVESRSSHGGTSTGQIEAQLARLEALMDEEERWLSGFGAG